MLAASRIMSRWVTWRCDGPASPLWTLLPSFHQHRGLLVKSAPLSQIQAPMDNRLHIFRSPSSVLPSLLLHVSHFPLTSLSAHYALYTQGLAFPTSFLLAVCNLSNASYNFIVVKHLHYLCARHGNKV